MAAPAISPFAPSSALPPDDHAVASEMVPGRDFACVAQVSHLQPADNIRLRAIPAVVEVLPSAGGADLHLIVSAVTARAARRLCVEQLVQAVPHAVVAMTDVVDYEVELAEYLGRHPEFEAAPDTIDDAEVVAELLERRAG